MMLPPACLSLSLILWCMSATEPHGSREQVVPPKPACLNPAPVIAIWGE